MRSMISWRRLAAGAALVACVGTGTLFGQGQGGPYAPNRADNPAARGAPANYGPYSGSASRTDGTQSGSVVRTAANLPMEQAPQPQAAEHPLAGALRMANSSLETINKDLHDYTCTMIKQERIDGKLKEEEYMYAKVRHEPFSVYLRFLKPEDAKGREVIYVEGRNAGKLTAHEGSGLKSKFGAVDLLPTSALAMDGNKYPITQLGVKNLVRRLIEVGSQDMKYGECDVTYRKNAKVNDRVCTIIEVTHPVPRRNFLFHKALIYVDDQLNVPIRYEAYTWPKTQGGPPELDECYTYLNMKVNVGLTDADFAVANPKYHFK